VGWIPLDASLAKIYGKEFELSDKNKNLVELTTATARAAPRPSNWPRSKVLLGGSHSIVGFAPCRQSYG